MVGSKGVAIAAIAVVAVLLSGCARWEAAPPPQLPGQISCAPTHPGWYVYQPHNQCYPAYGFLR
jgi:hypothetical protein